MAAEVGRPAPRGPLALGGLLLAVLLAALVLAACGGGDAGGDAASGSAPASDEPEEDDEHSGTGEFEASFDDGGPAAFPVDLQAGDALRVRVEGVDAAISIAAGDDAATESFRRLVATDAEDYADHLEYQTELVTQELDGDAGDELAEAGAVFFGTDRSSDDVEGAQLVAPTTGTYTVLVTGSDGEADVTIEVEEGDDDGLDDDPIEHLDYLAKYGEHVDFFCDEDFFGGDPAEVTNYGPTVCDPDELEGALSGELYGDFTNDFGGNL